MRNLIASLVFVVTASMVLAEVVQHNSCKDQVGSCAIHEVRIDPCPEAASDAPCDIKRGKSATISFDYTPEFNSSTVHGQVYWVSPDGDKAFVGMNTNACEHTACPLNKNAKQTYTYTFDTRRKFPLSVYIIKWKLSNPDTQELCCFQVKIKLTKNTRSGNTQEIV